MWHRQSTQRSKAFFVSFAMPKNKYTIRNDPWSLCHAPRSGVISVQFWYLTSFVILSFCWMVWLDFCHQGIFRAASFFNTPESLFTCHTPIFHCYQSFRICYLTLQKVPSLLFHRTVPPLRFHYSTSLRPWQLTFCKKVFVLFWRIGRTWSRAVICSLHRRRSVI